MTLARILWGIMGGLILAGLFVLSTWGIPAPSARIEKIIPSEKLSE